MNGEQLSYSHDGMLGFVERSSHLEEYTRSRPASAGSRPRSLLSKVATAAAAAQVDEEPEPADAEPWILEGWGDGPSVSEAAQQAALKLGPYLKNVPTTLVGLGAGTRRVLSAGPQGRNGPLKASEARRKHGLNQQVERRASGPAMGTAAGGGGAYSPSPRRAPPPRNLEVGDESDVEPSSAAPCPGGQVPAAAAAAPPVYAYSGQPRTGLAQRTGATGVAGGPPGRQLHAMAAQQGPAAGAARLGRREHSSGSGGASAAAPVTHQNAAALGQPQAQGGPGAGAGAAPASPRHRSLSAEAYHTAGSGQPPARLPPTVARGAVPGQQPGSISFPGPGSGASQPQLQPSSGSSGYDGPGPSTAGKGSPAPGGPHPYGHPPLPPHPHLEPLSPMSARRGDAGPSEPGGSSADRRVTGTGGGGGKLPPRALSFTSAARAAEPRDSEGPTSSPHMAPGGGTLRSPSSHLVPLPGSQLQIPSHSQQASSAAPASSPSPPPQLPGLFLAGRRSSSSFRTETGLSGWDPEAPSIQSPQNQAAAHPGSNLSLLWIGPAASGAGTSGLQAGAASSSRGSPVAANQQRREQIGGSSRLLQRGVAGVALVPPAPAESSQGGYTGREGPRQSASRSSTRSQAAAQPSPDGPGSSALPAQDALAEFYASRVELGTGAGGAVSGGVGPGPPPRSGGGTAAGVLPVPPMRVTGLSKPARV